ARGVVFGDVEVRRFHQPVDDAVYGAVELVEVACVAAERGDAEEGGLHGLIAHAFGHVAEVPGPSADPLAGDDRNRSAREYAAVLHRDDVVAAHGVRMRVEIVDELD